MGLARACLRLSAVAALRDVTLAEGRVFDSRIGAIDALKPDERKPVVAVYTEDESGEPLSSQNGGPPFKPIVELVLEISMVEAGETDGQYELVMPATDAELEVSLDVLEGQIKVALFEDMAAPLSVSFRRAFLRAHHYQSLRFREEAKGTRFAYRYVIVRLELDDRPVLTRYDATLEGLARLPQPFQAIAEAWPDDLPEKAVALAIAGAFPQPALVPGLRLDARVQPGGDPRTRLNATFLRPKRPPCPKPILRL